MTKGQDNSGNSSSPSYLNPYRDVASKYRAAGWLGPIPLPHKEKHPPPTGWTGRNAPYPPEEQIKTWMAADKRQNIGIRLAGVDKEHEIIGIDVDHYASGSKDKRGGDQLKELETKFGVLPDTWISSARTDGISGIRYFRVPRGMAFRGQVESDIECIQKGHRFAVVWPSIHPNGSTYQWYAPGMFAVGNLRVSRDLPDARNLPLLPESWVTYLTNDKMVDDGAAIDMASTVSQIQQWADDTFHGDDDTEMCPRMRKTVEQQAYDILNEATSHDKIVKAHYTILRLAAEGHLGWVKAINQIEVVWVEDVIKRDKRGLDELKQELFRSRTNALRKIKSQTDGRVAIGAEAIDPRCDISGLCMASDSTNVSAAINIPGITAGNDGTAVPPGNDGAGVGSGGVPDDPIADVPRGPCRDVPDYRLNDDGNADHMYDMFCNSVSGPAFRWAEGRGWIVWHEGKDGNDGIIGQPHWELDRDGTQEIRLMWQKVRDRQEAYAETLQVGLNQLISQKSAGQANAALDAMIKREAAKYKKWKDFSVRSGMQVPVKNAIDAVKSRVGITISVNDLDQSPNLLGCGNGILELDGESVRLRRAQAQDYVTLNTGTDYETPSRLAQEKWDDYLETFLPDPDFRKTAQVILGHCIIGGNPEKVLVALKGDTNTGKSTMINAVEAAMGDYAMTVDQSMLKNQNFNSVLGAALNKRFAVCSEFDEEERLSASMIKRITGGTDKVTIPIKFSMEVMSGIPQFVLVLATNGVPTIAGADKALQNRLKTIPFSITPDKINKHMANTIKSVCGPAVLQWLVDGYVEYRRLGYLPTHELMDEANEDFMAELSDVAYFAHHWLRRNDDSRLVKEPQWSVTVTDMYQHYDRYCIDNKIPERKRLTKIALGKQLKALGIKTSTQMHRIGGSHSRWWFGVQIAVPKDNVIQMPGTGSADAIPFGPKSRKKDRDG